MGVRGFLLPGEKHLEIAFDHSNDHRQQNFQKPKKQISGYSEVGIAPGLGAGSEQSFCFGFLLQDTEMGFFRPKKSGISAK